MKAIIQHGHGGPEVLEFTDVDEPTVTEDGVLVRIRAASVDAWDWHVMRGDPRIMGVTGMLRSKNGIPGLDFAGVVEAVGVAVTDLQPGDEMYGAHAGAFAEFIAAPTQRSAPSLRTSLSSRQRRSRSQGSTP